MDIIKIFLFFLVISIIPIQIYSQVVVGKDEAGKEFEFRIVEDDPSQITNAFLGLELIGFDLGTGFFMGFGLDLNYLYKDKFQFKLNSFRPYASATDSESGSYYRGEEENGLKLKLFNRSEIGVTYFFASKQKRKNAQISLAVREEGFKKTSFILSTAIPNETRFGARAGFYYNQQSAGEILQLVVDTFGSGLTVNLTSFSVQGMYFGISSSSLQHFIIDSDEFGRSAKSRIRTFYLDLILGLGSSSHFHAYDALKEGFYPYKVDQEFGMRNLGFRLGWERLYRHAKWKSFGSRFGAEIGLKPVPDIPGLDAELQPTEKISKFFITFKAGIFFTGNIAR